MDYENIDGHVHQCIIRDNVREKRVGSHVIKKMALQYKNLWKGENVIVCDLDGTLCDITHRLKYGSGPEKNWPMFFAGIKDDTLRNDVMNKIRDLMVQYWGIRLILS